ncbi:MAG: OsmC family protein [Gammaproteobacteria bacterium]|uniref:OsmC family protein n=1 Tax=Pseudomaricurvus alcaniphilus TaxID=1166482 RepID=UPI00140E8834|nr:OsmC family protein [Pseudomaricurvus alcaniphilus]MBR9909322.1 OsmC family protein [Gammaproteobacteria bacterium]NHN38258.1 OsmC family protein [Pseudomaricurvus alcaniphilus]
MTHTANSPPHWARPVQTAVNIVSKLEQAPTLEALPPAERHKARKGEPYRFPLDVIIEPTSECGKRAQVLNATPGSASFEIHCDEGKMLGGAESAPTPLAYFMAGMGFCLMTHITGFLRFSDLDIRRIRLELRANFHTTLGHVERGNQGIGGCDGIETMVILDSDESEERLAEFLEICEEACIASQTILQATPVKVSLVRQQNTD